MSIFYKIKSLILGVLVYFGYFFEELVRPGRRCAGCLSIRIYDKGKENPLVLARKVSWRRSQIVKLLPLRDPSLQIGQRDTINSAQDAHLEVLYFQIAQGCRKR
jgi:hypothetical protein